MTTVDQDHEIAALADAMRGLQRLRSSRRVHAALSEATGVDLSQQAVQVLAALDGSTPVAQLAQAARMDVGAVSRALRVLEDEGYVHKVPSPENASVVLVTATAEGRATARRLADVRNDHLARSLEGWSPDDRRSLARLLRCLVDDLQATPYTEDPSTTTGGRP